MLKKKVIRVTVSGLLIIGISQTAAPIFATNSQDNDSLRQTVNKAVNTSSQDQIQEIKDELEAQVITLSDKDLDKDEFLKNLDSATKKKLEELTDNFKTRELSSDEALELRKQRVSLPDTENRTDKTMNMDESTKALAKDNFEKVLNGSITIDEAIAELKELGVTINDQQIRALQSHFNSKTIEETLDIYNKLRNGKITQGEARDEITKQRINLPSHDEND